MARRRKGEETNVVPGHATMKRPFDNQAADDVCGGGRALIAALISLLLAGSLYAQQGSRVRFKHLGIEQGLSQNTANAVVQDHVGFVWVGTQDGLNRFDGYRFTTFRNSLEDPFSLSDNFVYCLYVDREGVLWVGTEAGLNRFDRERERFHHFRHDPDDATSLSNDRVSAVVEDERGFLWVGTSHGLNRLDKSNLSGGFRRFHHDRADAASLSFDIIRELFVDRSGTLWVGTDGGGLNRYDEATGTFATFRHDEAVRHFDRLL